jgi:alanyl-tRNA synthetase
MTTLLYHDPDGPLTTTATVVAVGHDDAGRWVTLDQTVAHCHGGGQLADLGRLDDLAILDVRRVEGQVRHYLDGPAAIRWYPR